MPWRLVSLTPRTWARAWAASCRIVVSVCSAPSAKHSPATNNSGFRSAWTRSLPSWPGSVGGVAGDPPLRAEVAPLGVDTSGRGAAQPGAGDEHHLRQIRIAPADGRPGRFEGGDEAGPGGGLLGGGHGVLLRREGPADAHIFSYFTRTSQ